MKTRSAGLFALAALTFFFQEVARADPGAPTAAVGDTESAGDGAVTTDKAFASSPGQVTAPASEASGPVGYDSEPSDEVAAAPSTQAATDLSESAAAARANIESPREPFGAAPANVEDQAAAVGTIGALDFAGMIDVPHLPLWASADSIPLIPVGVLVGAVAPVLVYNLGIEIQGEDASASQRPGLVDIGRRVLRSLSEE